MPLNTYKELAILTIKQLIINHIILLPPESFPSRLFRGTPSDDPEKFPTTAVDAFGDELH